MVRNVTVQPAQAQVSMQRPTQGALFAPSNSAYPRASELNSNQMRSQRTSSPKAWTASPMPLSAPQRYASPDETFVGASEKPALKATPGPGVVRSSSGSQQALSPPRSALGRGPPQQVEGENSAGLHCDCPTCMETRRRGFVLCRLPCGHTVRAQIVDSELPAGCWGGGSGPGGCGARSESPPLLSAQQRDRDHTVTSSPPRSIMRQVSGIRNPVPSVGILAPLGNQHPPAPLSPPRGPASPSSPQQTPGTMYRKATSSLTSFNIPRDGGGPPPNVEVVPTQQMTSRSSGGGGGGCSGLGGSSQGGVGGEGRVVPGPPSREASTREKGPRRHERELVRTEAPLEARARRDTCDSTNGPTVAEVVTDSRGDVLHRMCNVILLSPQSNDKEQQLKVRGQIIGTYWDERDIGPSLDHPGEVQVMVTYVDACERSSSLLFPTKYATTFGDTETAEGNIIKWKASLCKVGKKFS